MTTTQGRAVLKRRRDRGRDHLTVNDQLSGKQRRKTLRGKGRVKITQKYHSRRKVKKAAKMAAKTS